MLAFLCAAAALSAPIDAAGGDPKQPAPAAGEEAAVRGSLAAARALLDHGDTLRAKQKLDAWIAANDARAPVDARIVAHAARGRALAKLGPAAGGARPEADYGAARDLWSSPAGRAFADAGGEHLGDAIDGVGEALYFFAEQKRLEAEKIRYPEYHGSGAREDVLRFVGTKVLAWTRDKKPAIEAAEREYAKVLAIEPVPPTRWVVASAARVGQAWAGYTAELRATPVPKEWNGHGVVPGTADLTYDELRAEYHRKLDEASEPQREQAKAAFKTCLAFAARGGYADDLSRSCEAWLAKNDVPAPKP
jgi:hypothetical protein